MLQAEPDPADFGEVVLGASKGLKVSLTNTGILDLVITGIALEPKARFFMVPKTLPITVATGAETVVMLTFEPGTALGTSTNELRISSNNLTGQVIVPTFPRPWGGDTAACGPTACQGGHRRFSSAG